MLCYNTLNKKQQTKIKIWKLMLYTEKMRSKPKTCIHGTKSWSDEKNSLIANLYALYLDILQCDLDILSSCEWAHSGHYRGAEEPVQILLEARSL